MKAYTKKILYSLFGFTAALSLGLLAPTFGVSASEQAPKDELITPSSYEQYLELNSPSDVAVNERFTAIADGNVIYLYDSVESVYRKYVHSQNADQSKNDVTKLQFSTDGVLFFSDKSTSLYRLDPMTANLLGERADLVCSTFVISGNELYFSNVSGGISSISKSKLSDLSISSSVAIVDNLVSDTVLAIVNEEIFYTDSGKYLYKYSNEQSSFITNFSNSLTSVAVTNSLFCCTDNSGSFYVYDFIDLYAERDNAEPLFSAEGSFSKLSLFSDFVYAVDGDCVKQYSLSKGEFTDYQICSTSTALNRLNGATDVCLYEDTLLVADSANSRISVRKGDGGYYAIPTNVSETTEQKLCATADTVLVWTDSRAYLYDLISAELLTTFSFQESKLMGAIGVYGRYYFVTSNNGYYYASLQQTSAEKSEWTLSSPVIKSGSHPTLLTADVYGNLYVAKSGSLYKYTESEFLDNTNANEPLFALPVGAQRLAVDYDGNVYALTGNTLTKFVAKTAWSSVEFSLSKAAVYSSAEQRVTAFAFGVEDNAAYLLYNGSYILSTPDLNLPTVKGLPTESSADEIFSSASATVEVVKTSPKSVLVEFNFEAFEKKPAYFPYLSLQRSEQARTALKLGETNDYAVLAEYDGDNRQYRTYLVKKGYFETLAQDEYSTVFSEELFGYTSNSVHLYKFPYLHSLMTVQELEKNQKLKLLGEITQLDHDYYLVECETENGKLLGYLPKAFVTEFDGSTPQTEKHELESLPADTDMIWRLAYLICGFLAICILTDYLILRKRPEEEQTLSSKESADTYGYFEEPKQTEQSPVQEAFDPQAADTLPPDGTNEN